MEDADLKILENDQNHENLCRVLNYFIENNSQSFSFEELNKSGQKQRIFNAVFKILNAPEHTQCYIPALDLLRILSRDKTGLFELVDTNRLNILLKHAAIVPGIHGDNSVDVLIDANHEVVVVALKVLCNLSYNATAIANQLASSRAINGILARVRLYREHHLPHSVKYFDMMLMFLITALVADVREKVRRDYHGLTYLTEALDLVVKENTEKLADDDVDLICQILKVMFNLLAKRAGIGEIVSAEVIELEEESLCLRLTSILHDLLIAKTGSEKREQLRSHVVDLLTTMPITCYSELIPQHQIGDGPEWDSRSMAAIHALVEFLEMRLDSGDTKRKQELLSPLLTVLVQLSRKQRPIRKYLKSQILPPLRDVMTRPEHGDSLRAGLCRLLTSPSTIVKDLAADFLFVLCKENVGRMIKYTGYGNAAGLFANRGLMCGRPNSSSSSYSSDSDSETEEYAAMEDKINPIIGCYEPPTKNLLENMTEEQKEFEAMKLVNVMDKLSREGIIQPCRIGDDGKPQPVEHILQLQESLPKDQIRKIKENHSDDEDDLIH